MFQQNLNRYCICVRDILQHCIEWCWRCKATQLSWQMSVWLYSFTVWGRFAVHLLSGVSVYGTQNYLAANLSPNNSVLGCHGQSIPEGWVLKKTTYIKKQDSRWVEFWKRSKAIIYLHKCSIMCVWVCVCVCLSVYISQYNERHVVAFIDKRSILYWREVGKLTR